LRALVRCTRLVGASGAAFGVHGLDGVLHIVVAWRDALRGGAARGLAIFHVHRHRGVVVVPRIGHRHIHRLGVHGRQLGGAAAMGALLFSWAYVVLSAEQTHDRASMWRLM
jgi:hypothetical protein